MSSANFVHVEPGNAAAEAARYADAWKSKGIADAQRALAEAELAKFRAGQPVAPFDAFVRLVKAIDPLPAELLEVGCASGYYADVLEARGLGAIAYVGADYSEEMVSLARFHRHLTPFHVADACRLPYGNGACALVVSGCVMVHLADWRESIREAARVARQYVMLHRLQTVLDGPEMNFTKEAYGERCFERWFNLRDVMQECERAGLRLWRTEPIGSGPDYEIASYLFEKTGR